MPAEIESALSDVVDTSQSQLCARHAKAQFAEPDDAFLEPEVTAQIGNRTPRVLVFRLAFRVAAERCQLVANFRARPPCVLHAHLAIQNHLLEDLFLAGRD